MSLALPGRASWLAAGPAGARSVIPHFRRGRFHRRCRRCCSQVPSCCRRHPLSPCRFCPASARPAMRTAGPVPGPVLPLSPPPLPVPRLARRRAVVAVARSTAFTGARVGAAGVAVAGTATAVTSAVAVAVGKSGATVVAAVIPARSREPPVSSGLWLGPLAPSRGPAVPLVPGPGPEPLSAELWPAPRPTVASASFEPPVRPGRCGAASVQPSAAMGGCGGRVVGICKRRHCALGPDRLRELSVY